MVLEAAAGRPSAFTGEGQSITSGRVCPGEG